MRITIESFDLPLRDPFTIARGTTTSQPTVIIRLEHDGYYGLGEATTNDYYGSTVTGMSDALRKIESTLPASGMFDPEQLWSNLDPVLSQNRFAQAALDCAAWDLWGKMNNAPVWQLWGLDRTVGPPSCYTLGIDKPEVMVRKLREMPGWPVYKIKLGTENDLLLVETLRGETEATFRVDANCGWRTDQVEPLSLRLKELGVEFIEQPLPPDNAALMRVAKQSSALPLMADESCQQESDVAGCEDCFDAINIKLVKCGGLTPARRMIAHARSLGLRVMVGCMTESSVGISAAAQLVPLLDFADLDGAVLLAQDIATGVRVVRGKIELSDSPGLGVELLPV